MKKCLKSGIEKARAEFDYSRRIAIVVLDRGMDEIQPGLLNGQYQSFGVFPVYQKSHNCLPQWLSLFKALKIKKDRSLSTSSVQDLRTIDS